jgi:peptidoglycan/LPS O-acetylase OafA/YrhL
VFLLGEDAWGFLKHLGAGLIYGHGFIYGSGNPINPVTWSLETEAQFYAIIPLIMWLVFKGRNLAISILLLSGLIVGSIIFRNEFAFSAHFGRSIGAYFANFAMGIGVCWLYLKFPLWIKVRGWLYDVLGVIATAGLFYFYKPQHEISNQIFFNISIALVMITAFKGKLFNWLYTRPLIYTIGGMCYSIYLNHYAFLHLSLKFTKYLFVYSWSYSQNLLVQVFVNVTLVLLVSAVFFMLVEKPTMDKNWPKKLLYHFKRS